MAWDQNELVKARTQSELSDVAMAPVRRRLIEAQAGKLEEEVATAKRFRDLMMGVQQSDPLAGIGGPEGVGAVAMDTKPISLADQIDGAARLAMGGGFIEKAADLAGKAALVRAREARQADSLAGASNKVLQFVRDDAKLTASLLADVKDQDSWNRANALYTFQTGRPSRYASVPFSPELVKSIRDGAISTEKQADLEEKRLKREADERYRKQRLGQIDTQNEIRDRRLTLEREREERLSKAGGGKTVAGPAKAEVDQAARLIRKDYPDLQAADLNDSAYSIAAEARALRKRNPALDANTAIQQAIAQAVQDGDFKTSMKEMGGLKIPGTSKSEYLGRGKTAATPAAIPADKGQLREGRYYVNGQGQVGVWTGQGFKLTRALSVDNSRVGGTSDDDDEDDDNDE